MKTRIITAALLCGIVVLFTTCDKEKNNETIEVLTSQTWTLESIKSLDNGQMLYPLNFKTHATLTISANGEFSGNSGCNGYSGEATIDKHQLHFDNPLSTHVGCIGVNDKIEEAVWNALHNTDNYEIKEGSLLLKSGSDILATYIANAGGGKTDAEILTSYTWTATLIESANGKILLPRESGIQTTLTILPNGLVSGNSACNEYSGQAVINNNQLRVNNPGAATEMLCGELRGEIEDALMNALRNTDNYDINGGVLRLKSGDKALAIFILDM